MLTGKRILGKLSQYRYHFYNKPVYINTSEGTFVVPRKGPRAQLLVGRGLSMFRYHDFSNVPKNRRALALAQKIALWSPFEKTDYHSHWDDSAAMVWYWDARQASNLPDEKPEETDIQAEHSALTKLPEAIFLPNRTEGVYIQQCQHGFDLQYWNSERLVDSRWFAEQPTDTSVKAFCVQHKVAEQATTSPLTWQQAPWRQVLSPQQWLQVYEKNIVVAALIALSAVFLWQETRYWKAHWLTGYAAEQYAQSSIDLDPLLQDRSEVQRYYQINEAILKVVGEPSQVRLMTDLSQAIPNDEALFKQWLFQRGQLEVTVEDASADPIEYVRRVQALPLFSDVHTEQARKENALKLVMKLNP